MFTKILSIFLLLIGGTYGQEKEAFQAPIHRGSFEISGNVLYSKGEAKSNIEGEREWNYESSILSITPEILYFLLDRLSVGISFQYQAEHSNVEAEGDDIYVKIESTDYTVGPVARYFIRLTDRFYPFINAKYLFGSGEDYSENWNIDVGYEKSEKTDVRSLQMGLGGDYFLNRNVSLRALIQYEIRNTGTENYDGEKKYWSVGLGLAVFLD